MPHLSIALANSGDIQLELIQQRCKTPSLYWDFLNAGKEGSSTGRAGRSTTTRSATRRWRSGWHVGQEGESERGPFIYFLEEGHPGTVIEMAEATPTRMSIFDQVREAAKNWDGSDPIRENWPAA